MKYKHVESYTSRHGRRMWFFRVGKDPRLRLPCGPDDPAFPEHYAMAEKRWLYLLDQKNQALKSAEARVEIEKLLAKRVKNARARDKQKNRDGDITPEWAVQKMRDQGYTCAVTGISFFQPPNARWRVNPFNPSLDRIDPKKGYTTDNVRVVLFGVNMMILDWGDDVFFRIAEAYVKNMLPPTARNSPNRLQIIE